MRAIILAAGLGSRIKNDVNNIPKPLLKVGKKNYHWKIDWPAKKKYIR